PAHILVALGSADALLTDPPSLPTRRSSDLRSFTTDSWNTAHHLLRMRDDAIEAGWQPTTDTETYADHPRLEALAAVERLVRLGPDRKSTRLNSSHVSISYAVFCLKRKKLTI